MTKLRAETVAVLTTYNRPEVLTRTFDRIVRQCAMEGVRLIVFDDRSDDADTLGMLERADVEVVKAPQPELKDLHPHFRIGLNFLHAIDFISTRWPDVKWMLKLDDDAYLGDGAIEAMFRARRDAERAAGHTKVLAVSGITTRNETPHGRIIGGAASRVSAACSVAVFHRMDFLRRFVEDLGAEEIVEKGWDSAFFWIWAKEHEPEARSYAACPSVVFHMAHTGVHLIEVDVNRPKTDWMGFQGRRPRGWPSKTLVPWSDDGRVFWDAHYGGKRRTPGGGMVEQKADGTDPKADEVGG